MRIVGVLCIHGVFMKLLFIIGVILWRIYQAQQIVRVWFTTTKLNAGKCMVLCAMHTEHVYSLLKSTDKSLLPSIHAIALHVRANDGILTKIYRFSNMLENCEKHLVCVRIVLRPANLLLITNYKETCELAFRATAHKPLRKAWLRCVHSCMYVCITSILFTYRCVRVCTIFDFFVFLEQTHYSIQPLTKLDNFIRVKFTFLVRVIWRFACANLNLYCVLQLSHDLEV